MKLKSIILGALILFGDLGAEETERITGAWFVSLPGDWVGGGEAKSYMKEGDLYIYACDCQIHAGLGHGFDSFGAIFASKVNEVLIPGVYKGAKRFSAFPQDCPGLEISGSGRGHGALEGEFEILEIEFDEHGELASFAVNFIQNGFDGKIIAPPMFGGIRYNSTIPFEYGFISKPVSAQVPE